MATAAHSITGRSRLVVLRSALWPPLLAVAILVLISVCMDLLGLSESFGTWLWFSPLALLAACALTAGRLIRGGTEWAFSPVVWALLALAAYYGFGPLIYSFGDQSVIRLLDAGFPVDNYWLFRTNLLNLVGILALLIGLLLPTYFGNLSGVARAIDIGRDIPAKTMLYVSIAVGFSVKYLIAIPRAFGLLGFTPPSTITELQQLTLVSIVISGFLTRSGTVAYRALFLLLIVADLSSGLLVNSKLATLQVLIAAMLGRAMATRSTRTLLQGFAVIALAAILLNPIVSDSRAMGITDESSGILQAVETRSQLMLDAVSRFWRGESDSVERAPQSWWMRFCYAPTQAFVLHEYDSGRPGDIGDNIFWVFVPRALYSDKPLINPGTAFSYLFDGNPDNSNAPGAIAEGYWYGGWVGLAIGGLYIGWILMALHSISMRAILSENWFLMPFVLMGIRAGFRVDGWFVMEYVGGIVMYVALLAVALGLLRMASKPHDVWPRKRPCAAHASDRGSGWA